MSPLWEELLEVMSQLRGTKEGKPGCPWDMEQTPQSLKPFVIEEAYEVVQAIEEGDPGKIAEELGDLLLQVIFQAQIGKEAGAFTIDDVIASLLEKLRNRHPHVFGEGTAESAAPVNSKQQWDLWERRKMEERGGSGSVLEGVSPSLPSLLQATLLLRRAAGVGFDWKNLGGALEKVREEVEEFFQADLSDDLVAIEEEMGDTLFAFCSYARWRNLDPEEALRKSLTRFKARFQKIEREANEQPPAPPVAGSSRSATLPAAALPAAAPPLAAPPAARSPRSSRSSKSQGKDRLRALSLEEWLSLWEKAKRGER